MNDDHSSMAMNAISHAALMVQHSIQQAISEYGEPSAIYRPKVFPDGNVWCALYGDTPASAIRDFNNKWYGR